MTRQQLETEANSLSQATRKECIGWIEDCLWYDIDNDEDVQALTDFEIVKGIDSNFGGGWQAFKKDCEFCQMQENNEKKGMRWLNPYGQTSMIDLAKSSLNIK
tara:strand:+ start:86894 stop:87202 length:309 start_codon:yes stop_codon:yes gene_type:complete